jgi:hypothetical protein
MSVEQAVLLPPSVVLARLPEAALDRVPVTVRAGVLALEAGQGTTNGSAA